MPTRILREGILTSEKVNALSESDELFYRRLMSVVDDYGRYFAHPALLRAACFPLRLDKVTEADVKRMLSGCVAVALIVLYDGGKHLFLTNFKQQTRAASKFPEPSGNELLNNGLSECKSNVLGVGVGVGVGVGDEGEGESRKRRSSGELPEEAKIWNSHPKLPKVESISTDRAKSLHARRRDPYWVENYKEAVRRVANSEFCLGGGNRGWKANFDFILQPSSVVKVMEGQYDGNGKATKYAFNPATDLPTEPEPDYPAIMRERREREARERQGE